MIKLFKIIIGFVVAVTINISSVKAQSLTITSSYHCGTQNYINVSGGSPPYKLYAMGTGCGPGIKMYENSTGTFSFSDSKAEQSLKHECESDDETPTSFIIIDNSDIQRSVSAPLSDGSIGIPGVTGNKELRGGLPIRLTASASNATTYQWYYSNQSPITGETGSTYNPSITSPTRYYIRAFNDCGASLWKSVDITYTIPEPSIDGKFHCDTNEVGEKEYVLKVSGAISGEKYILYMEESGGDYLEVKSSTSGDIKFTEKELDDIDAANTSFAWNGEDVVVKISKDGLLSLEADPREIIQRFSPKTESVILTGNTNSCFGGFNLEAQGSTFATPGASHNYQWYNSSKNSISGETSSTYDPPGTGTYYVRSYNPATTCWSAYAPAVATRTPPSPPNLDCTTQNGDKVIRASSEGFTSYKWYGSEPNPVQDDVSRYFNSSSHIDQQIRVKGVTIGECETALSAAIAGSSCADISAPLLNDSYQCDADYTIKVSHSYNGTYHLYAYNDDFPEGVKMKTDPDGNIDFDERDWDQELDSGTPLGFFITIEINSNESTKLSVDYPLENVVPKKPIFNNDSYNLRDGAITLEVGPNNTIDYYKWYRDGVSGPIPVAVDNTYLATIPDRYRIIGVSKKGACLSEESAGITLNHTIPEPGISELYYCNGNESDPYTEFITATGANANEEYIFYLENSSGNELEVEANSSGEFVFSEGQLETFADNNNYEWENGGHAEIGIAIRNISNPAYTSTTKSKRYNPENKTETVGLTAGTNLNNCLGALLVIAEGYTYEEITSNHEYHWYDKDKVEIPGAVSSGIVSAPFQPAETGAYYVRSYNSGTTCWSGYAPALATRTPPSPPTLDCTTQNGEKVIRASSEDFTSYKWYGSEPDPLQDDVSRYFNSSSHIDQQVRVKGVTIGECETALSAAIAGSSCADISAPLLNDSYQCDADYTIKVSHSHSGTYHLYAYNDDFPEGVKMKTDSDGNIDFDERDWDQELDDGTPLGFFITIEINGNESAKLTVDYPLEDAKPDVPEFKSVPNNLRDGAITLEVWPDVDIDFYDWYLNEAGPPISGATDNTYLTTTPGTYGVIGVGNRGACPSKMSSGITLTHTIPSPSISALYYCNGNESGDPHTEFITATGANANEEYVFYLDGSSGNDLEVEANSSGEFMFSEGQLETFADDNNYDWSNDGHADIGIAIRTISNPVYISSIRSIRYNPDNRSETVSLTAESNLNSCFGEILFIAQARTGGLSTGSHNYQWYDSDKIAITEETSSSYSPPDIGTYFVRCTNPETTCWSAYTSATGTRTEPPPPFVQRTNKKCGQGDLEIFAYGDYNSYHWYDAEDQLIPDNTFNNLTIHFSATDAPVQYKVTGLQDNGCESLPTEFTALAVDNCENYIHETTTYTEGSLNENDIELLSHEKKTETWNYFDGIGRNIQTVNQQFSPSVNGVPEPKDFVTPILYDNYGREVKSFLPYADAGSSNGSLKPDPVNSGDELIDYYSSPQYLFYEGHFKTPNLERDYPYSKRKFDSSPLNRVLQEAAQGDYWHFGATDRDKDNPQPTNAQTKYDYTTNGSDEVRLWTIPGAELVDGRYQKLESTDNYLKEKLWLNVVTDENGVMRCEYKDLQGRIILKKVQVENLAQKGSHDGWACTYYIYDELSNLRYVIPPQAVQEMVNEGDWTLVNDTETGGEFIDNWLFYYEYDDRHRMTIKKVPGADPVYMVYDNRNRRVLIQDGNKRSAFEWLFTKYDKLNRPVMTGMYAHDETLNQSEMQVYVDLRIAKNYETETYTWHESRTDDINSLHGYDNKSFPKTNEDDSGLNIHSVTYYDDYSFLTGGGLGKTYFDDGTAVYSYDNTLISCQKPGENLQVKGQVAGGKIRIIDPDGTELYLNTVTYFDDRYRTIQTVSKNHLGEIDRFSACYEGITETITESFFQSTLSSAAIIHRVFEYDHEQRLLSIEHRVNGETPIKILENQYNQLGQLIEKNLHQQDDNDPWQSIDYKYNIRGWLTHINDAILSEEDSETLDLFGMELYYADGFDEPVYNGNISGVKWKSMVDDDRMAYGYTYDKLNRIVSADYVKGTDPDNWKEEGYYNMQIRGVEMGEDLYQPGYDLNGNILTLKRWGFDDNHESMIDNLTYDYVGSGNQLNKVDDAIRDPENKATNNPGNGFKDGADLNNDGKDYRYDANGNMISDDNKEIEKIEYNFLNLPMVVKMTDGRKIKYIYDAAGIKLAQRVYEDENQEDENQPATKVTDYIGEHVYETKKGESRELQFLHHEEGRIVPGPKLDDPDWIPDPPNWEYQYHLKDHLGNSRLTFGAPSEDEYNLTMEIDLPENRIMEDRDFENVTRSEDNYLPDHNHTPTVPGVIPKPEYVVKLDGATKIIGPAKSLKVLPGDEINIDVWAKYLHVDGGYDPSVAVDLLLKGFSGAFINSASEMLINKGYVDGPLLGSLADIFTGKNHDGVPEAYINYILFDKNYQVIVEDGERQSKKLRISDEGKYDEKGLGSHEQLTVPSITINQEGYIYIYLSNNTPLSEVIFDDLTIKHKHSFVIQKNDYYPFGLSIAHLTTSRENSLKNKWTFQGQEVQDDFDLGWHAFKWRNHQPEIGRFFNIDPLAADYYYNSPYAFSENRVTDGFELEGLEWVGMWMRALVDNGSDPQEAADKMMAATFVPIAIAADVYFTKGAITKNLAKQFTISMGVNTAVNSWVQREITVEIIQKSVFESLENTDLADAVISVTKLNDFHKNILTSLIDVTKEDFTKDGFDLTKETDDIIIDFVANLANDKFEKFVPNGKYSTLAKKIADAIASATAEGLQKDEKQNKKTEESVDFNQHIYQSDNTKVNVKKPIIEQ